MNKRFHVGTLILALASAWIADANRAPENTMTMILTSPAFAEGGNIPAKFTCEGLDISPPLAWRGTPATSRSLLLIVDDPDAPDPAAPKTTWVHWLLYNLPPDVHELPEAVTQAHLPRGTLEGLNDWKRAGYGGPCPPIGRHRYFYKMYALDVVLPDLGKPSKAALEAAMHGHVLAKSELMGTYQKHDAK